MKPREVLARRMHSLLLAPSSPEARTVAEVVEWFGAMQAQDLGSGLWSLGARLPGHTAEDVQQALEDKQALRTWPMRGTVHFVPSRDARWMLELTGRKVLGGAERRHEHHDLDRQAMVRAVDVLGAALTGGGRMTRAQCLQALEEAGIGTQGQRSYHFLWYASQVGVTCIAPSIGNEQTFVLLDEWVPDPARPGRGEALATLAIRYFRSHGPTTRKDFMGWTGLNTAEAKEAIAEAGDELATITCEGTEMYCPPALLDAPAAPPRTVRALPGFDEYLLGFKDRALMVDAAHAQAIVPGNNGVFRPTIVRSGRVIATWRKKSLTRAGQRIEVDPLVPVSESARAAITGALAPYGRFLGTPVELRWPKA
ncbi:winged helix DNA-binding domain-containing protein [Lolliginicoccus suaedae]|uniref:winged helix DNA-binding domain-containing protein n=1 Tax=Lolliginicoccus suaedae TaxID=2605429 RepID=UPI001F1CD34B|nr:winged helix DNA-binding domain-containing protein [Lolliginicoccus suaedae]